MQSRCETYEFKCTAVPWISKTQCNFSSASQITPAHVQTKILLSPVMWETCDVTGTSVRLLTLRHWSWKQQFCPKIYYSFTMLRGVNKELPSHLLTWKPQIFIFIAPNTSNIHIHCSETLKASIHCPGKLKSLNSLHWESKSYITTALKTSKLHIHSPDKLKASYALPWKPQIFKFTALRI